MSNNVEIIHSYTRREALEDGTLVDATEMASEVGFKCPVALTADAWASYVAIPEDAEGCGQDESARLWDILFVLHNCIKVRPIEGPIFLFKVAVVNAKQKRKLVTLKSILGGDDDGALCITVAMPEED